MIPPWQHGSDHRRRRDRAFAARERGGAQPRRRPVRDRRRRDRVVCEHGDGGIVERRPWLRRAGIPTGRHSPRRGRRHSRRCSTRACSRSRLHGLQRAPGGAGAGRLAREVRLRPVLEVLRRHHGACAPVGARSDLEHDHHTRCRADVRDRDHGSARRAPPADCGYLPEDGALAWRARNPRQNRARDGASERADPRLRLDLCGQHRLRCRRARRAGQRPGWSARTPLAALPAIRRAVRLPLRDALQATGSAVGGDHGSDRLLRRVHFLPRTAQIGLRNVSRRRRRSLSTAIAIAFAVGTLLAVLGLADGVANTSRASWGDHGEDVRISSEGRRPLNAQAARLIRTTPGDEVRVQTASGPVDLRVIGISANQQENGTALFVPLPTMHALLPGIPADANDYWVRTTSHDHAVIDRTTTRIEDTLTTHGYDVSSEVKYVRLANEIANYRTLTTNDRRPRLPDRRDQHGRPRECSDDERARTHTRDRHPSLDRRPCPRRPPHLRHRNPRSRPHGLADRDPARLPARPLPRLADQEVSNVEIPFTFPRWYLAPAVAGTIVLAPLITVLPIRRAVRYRPGDALRYA